MSVTRFGAVAVACAVVCALSPSSARLAQARQPQPRAALYNTAKQKLLQGKRVAHGATIPRLHGLRQCVRALTTFRLTLPR